MSGSQMNDLMDSPAMREALEESRKRIKEYFEQDHVAMFFGHRVPFNGGRDIPGVLIYPKETTEVK
jgi:hypothetical protein